jgi:hypothetical protein
MLFGAVGMRRLHAEKPMAAGRMGGVGMGDSLGRKQGEHGTGG